MPRISLKDPNEAKAMTGIAGPEARRALVHRPTMADAIGALNAAVLGSELPARMHELVRYRIALINGCARCQAYRSPAGQAAGITEQLLNEVTSWPDSTQFSNLEQLSLDYAERFCLDPQSIDEYLIDALRGEIDDGGVLDLTVCVAKYLAVGRLISVLDLDQVCEIGQPTMEAS